MQRGSTFRNSEGVLGAAPYVSRGIVYSLRIVCCAGYGWSASRIQVEVLVNFSLCGTRAIAGEVDSVGVCRFSPCV